MPLVIYGLGVYTNTHTHTRTHTFADKSDYKKKGSRWPAFKKFISTKLILTSLLIVIVCFGILPFKQIISKNSYFTINN